MKSKLIVLTIAIFSFSTFIGCKDVCKDIDCQNGGACSEVDGEGVCTCATGYEGTNCETAINQKFVSTYTVTDSIHGAGSSTSTLDVLASTSNPSRFTMENFGGFQTSIPGDIGADGLEFTVPSTDIGGGYTISGTGMMASNNISFHLDYQITSSSPTITGEAEFVKN